MSDIKGKFPNGLAEAMQRAEMGSTALASLIGDSKQNVTRWANQSRRLTPVAAEKIAPHLKTTAAALLLVAPGAVVPSAPSPIVREAILGPDISDMRRGPRDVPVLGITIGGDTDDDDDRDPDFWLNGEVVNYVVRPSGLSHVKDLFSLYVQGDSMWPRYEENDLIFLTKAAPAIGDDVVIELHKKAEDGDHATFVKRLVRRRGSYLTVRQYNPDKEIDFSIKEIRNLFRVIPTKEWVG